MDKPVSETQPKDDAKTKDVQPTAQPANAQPMPTANAPAFGAYNGKTTNLPPDLSTDAWEKSKGTAWNATPQGRAAIRTFSRGVMGAAFFAAGNLLAVKWMNGYESHKGFAEQDTTLKRIAKGIDTVVGKPIQWTVEALSGSKEAGLNAVHFRPTKYMNTVLVDGAPQKVFGRSLGNEVVGVTFDFFCASIGDALGRDMVNWFDPNQKKGWQDKDGNFSLTEAAKNAGKAAFRYVTYNGGEDWAVAIPYVYFMKGQRALIDRYSPGFKYDFDRSLNGGSFKIDNNQKVIGAYGMEGALDLQTRFTVYNIGTLMYREAYNHIADSITRDKPSALYGAPDAPDKDKKGLLEKMGDVGKWIARSAVKGAIYMTPAVPFFWITRSAQSKDRGVFVNQEKGVLESGTGGRVSTVRPYEITDKAHGNFVGQGEPVFYGNYEHGRWEPTTPTNTFPSVFNEHFQPYQQGGGVLDRAFDTIGSANNTVKDKAVKLADQLDMKMLGNSTYKSAKDKLGIGYANQFATRFANAAISYTPYMYAKAEFANLWDDGKMDLATERMIDGATSLNWGEFKAGVGEVWNAVMHKPLSEPKREAEAKRRIALDNSAPADFRHIKAERESSETAAPNPLSWRERIVAGRADDKTQAAQPVDSRPRSHAENEAMKKALEELSPPTNAIH